MQARTYLFYPHQLCHENSCCSVCTGDKVRRQGISESSDLATVPERCGGNSLGTALEVDEAHDLGGICHSKHQQDRSCEEYWIGEQNKKRIMLTDQRSSEGSCGWNPGRGSSAEAEGESVMHNQMLIILIRSM